MKKMKQCKKCSKEFPINYNFCPECGAINSIYKIAAGLWAIALILILILFGVVRSSDSRNVESVQEVSQNSENAIVENKSEDKVEDNIPKEYKSALREAKSYSDNLHMSKASIYDQLTSEFGANLTAEVAQYAVDNVDVNWKENALIRAEFYQRKYQGNLAYSKEEIYDELISEFEKFTPEEAQYAIDNLK